MASVCPLGRAAGKRVAVLPAAAYGGAKDVSDAWAMGVLAVGAGACSSTWGRGPCDA